MNLHLEDETIELLIGKIRFTKPK